MAEDPRPRGGKEVSACVDCGASNSRVSLRCRPCNALTSRTLDHNKLCACGVLIRPKSESCRRCHNRRQDKGLSTERAKFQNSKEWKDVRLAAFKRDDFTCQSCNKKGSQIIQAHHIKSYKAHPALRLSLPNLITYCIGCHRKWHKENGR